jgi:hypothetical protein
VGFQNSEQGFDQWQSALSRRSCMIVDVSLRLLYLIFLRVLGSVLLRGAHDIGASRGHGLQARRSQTYTSTHRRLQTSRGGQAINRATAAREELQEGARAELDGKTSDQASS